VNHFKSTKHPVIARTRLCHRKKARGSVNRYQSKRNLSEQLSQLSIGGAELEDSRLAEIILRGKSFEELEALHLGFVGEHE